MVMFFQDLFDDVLLVILQETPLSSRLRRLTLVNRRFHRLVSESLRQTKSLAIVFPRNGKSKTSTKNHDLRLAYFCRNYRLKVLPEADRLYYFHQPRRFFPAHHLLSLFPRLTNLQLVHPRLGDSFRHRRHLIAYLKQLQNLQSLSVFFFCSNWHVVDEAIIGRLGELLVGLSPKLRSLTLTVDLSYHLFNSGEGFIKSTYYKGVFQKINLLKLQKLTVLFGGRYNDFSETFLAKILQSLSGPNQELKSLTFNRIDKDISNNQLTTVLSSIFNETPLNSLSTTDLFFSPSSPQLKLPITKNLQELHLQEVSHILPLDILLLQLSFSSSLQVNLCRLRVDFTSFRHSVFRNSNRNSGRNQSSFPGKLTGLQTLFLQNSSLLHGGVAVGGSDKKDDDNERDTLPLDQELEIEHVAYQTPNLKTLILAGNFDFSERFSGYMSSGARMSVAKGPENSVDCPRCRNKLLEVAGKSDNRKWTSTDEKCLRQFKAAVAKSAWANTLKKVAIQREDNWSLQNSLEMVFDEMYLK